MVKVKLKELQEQANFSEKDSAIWKAITRPLTSQSL